MVDRARLEEVKAAVNNWPHWPDGTPRNAVTYWQLLDALNGWEQAAHELAQASAPVQITAAPANDADAMAADRIEHASRFAQATKVSKGS